MHHEAVPYAANEIVEPVAAIFAGKKAWWGGDATLLGSTVTDETGARVEQVV